MSSQLAVYVQLFCQYLTACFICIFWTVSPLSLSQSPVGRLTKKA